jgi:hypothetical protein
MAPCSGAPALAQLIAVAALFVLLLAVPLPGDFFRDYGAVIGPVSWVGCALLAGRVLSLRVGVALAAALASGAVAANGGLLLSHSLGLALGVAGFGLGRNAP